MEKSETLPRVQKGANLAKRNALGRGLSALMSATAVNAKGNSVDNKIEQSESTTVIEGSGVQYIALENLTPNPSQPRTEFPSTELNELAESIRESGLIQPIIVRKSGPAFEIVAGERRFRASKIAGLKEVPVIVRELSDKETLAIAIVENVQRQDLNPMDEALAYQRLIEEFQETQSTVAKTVGKDRVSIANALRLLKLPDDIKLLISEGKLTAGHGRALLMVTNGEVRTALAKRIIAEALSVRATEQIASLEKLPPISALKPAIEKVDELLLRSQLELSERFRRALGTKVNVTLSSHDRGELKISFYSREELESVLEKFEAKTEI